MSILMAPSYKCVFHSFHGGSLTSGRILHLSRRLLKRKESRSRDASGGLSFTVSPSPGPTSCTDSREFSFLAFPYLQWVHTFRFHQNSFIGHQWVGLAQSLLSRERLCSAGEAERFQLMAHLQDPGKFSIIETWQGGGTSLARPYQSILSYENE